VLISGFWIHAGEKPTNYGLEDNQA